MKSVVLKVFTLLLIFQLICLLKNKFLNNKIIIKKAIIRNKLFKIIRKNKKIPRNKKLQILLIKKGGQVQKRKKIIL